MPMGEGQACVCDRGPSRRAIISSVACQRRVAAGGEFIQWDLQSNAGLCRSHFRKNEFEKMKLEDSSHSNRSIDREPHAKSLSRRPMGRKARINFRERISLSGLQIRIRSQPARDWPSYLFFAWEILSSKPELTDVIARSIILESVLEARQCVAAQSDRLSDIARIRIRTRTRTACSRIPKCIKRGPKALRRHLNQAILPLIEESIDAEVLEFILETARKTFEAFPDNEPSCAALNSLKGVHFSGLPTTTQDKVRKAIVGFKTAKNAIRTAEHLFIAIGEALKSENGAKTSTQIGHLIVSYVAKLAAIWRRADLEPTRARRYLDLNPTIYSSKFHEFAELVLLAMTGPRAGYCGKSRPHNAITGARDPAMSNGTRPWIEASRKGEKYKWLVSDNHLKRALGHGIQN
jgi:hypothetical protein